jgi:phosphoglycolate phosphatase
VKLPRQIIWDWNGTLLDDAQASINALNSLLRERRLPLLDRKRYRADFGFPVRAFYGAIGITVDDQAWDELAILFHERYRREPAQVSSEARALLGWLQARNVPQAILSACEQRLLDTQVAEQGLAGTFVAVQGTDNFDGRSKIEVGRQLLRRLAVPGVSLLIGDTLHDAEVADALGCDCVLVACGHQNRERLATAGCPVFDSLAEVQAAFAAALAGRRQ